MEAVLEGPEALPDDGGGAATESLGTLTSGLRREVRGCAFQAHVCTVTSAADVEQVIAAFARAEAFKTVCSWSYAFRLEGDEGAGRATLEDAEDGLDEGTGRRILGVLQRLEVEGLMLLVSRWQDYGASPGLELFGTELYSIVTERCKDLIASLKSAMGLDRLPLRRSVPEPPPGPRTFDFASLPPIPEPVAASRYGKNHFMSDSGAAAPAGPTSLDLVGGDVRLWMSNDQCLQNLPDSELWSLRSMRQPDSRLESILSAVALLMRKHVPTSAATPAARWCVCREVLRSTTLRTELLLFDAARVPAAAAQAALELLDKLELNDVRRISAGAAALYEWAQGVARWRLEGPPPSREHGGRLAQQSLTGSFSAGGLSSGGRSSADGRSRFRASAGSGAFQRAASEALLSGPRPSREQAPRKRLGPSGMLPRRLQSPHRMVLTN